jgi:hypothetical protein
MSLGHVYQPLIPTQLFFLGRVSTCIVGTDQRSILAGWAYVDPWSALFMLGETRPNAPFYGRYLSLIVIRDSIWQV